MASELSYPQHVFLNELNTKFRAYVGGFGCMHPDTKVHTEHGLMRIADITSSTRVVSWNDSCQKFQLSLSGGSFPKGKGNLLEISTSQGVFAASEHHRAFSSSRNYQSAANLDEGSVLLSASKYLLSTIRESGLLWLPSNDEHSNQTHADLMGSYADEARLYGQQFLAEEDSDLSLTPLSVDAQGFSC